MQAVFELATLDDVVALVALHMAVTEHLTDQHGRGPWSRKVTESGVLFGMRTAKVFVGRRQGAIVGTFRLTTRKPWAIDTRYFSACARPLYLLDMAVAPSCQRQGIGSGCLKEAQRAAKVWSADAIRLDAFDAAAGAGGFYARCGFTEVGRVTYRKVPLIYYELLVDHGRRGEL
jgi:GNAT superfamily N-acetyltransferase